MVTLVDTGLLAGQASNSTKLYPFKYSGKVFRSKLELSKCTSLVIMVINFFGYYNIRTILQIDNNIREG